MVYFKLRKRSNYFRRKTIIWKYKFQEDWKRIYPQIAYILLVRPWTAFCGHLYLKIAVFVWIFVLFFTSVVNIFKAKVCRLLGMLKCVWIISLCFILFIYLFIASIFKFFIIVSFLICPLVQLKETYWGRFHKQSKIRSSFDGAAESFRDINPFKKEFNP